MRILIVEDEINTREGLADLLVKINSDYIVCGKASDGEQGFELAKELKPDLIIADIEMPKLNGLEMIEKIKSNTSIDPLFLILSGYSDFKYAQRGIKLGINEYLLKPITYNNLKNVIVEMNDKLKAKNERVSISDMTIPEDQILKEILIMDEKISEIAYKIVERNLTHDKNMFVLNFHLMEKYRDKHSLFTNLIIDFIDFYKIRTCYYSYIEEFNYITVFIQTGIEFDEIIKMLKYNLIFSFNRNGFTDICTSIIVLNELREIKNSLHNFLAISKWSLVFGTKEIISYDMIQKIRTRECIYPKNFETEAQQLVKNNDYKKLLDVNQKLVLTLKNDVRDPDKIIEFCSRYVFSIISYLALLNRDKNNTFNEFEEKGIINLIKNSCTMEELAEHLHNFVENICIQEEDSMRINSLPVRRAINYINEYYYDKISLDEMAAKMNITPEYLSRLFTKEIGKSFSDYIKEYRINKAKSLLLNEKIKIYEIAEKVGYCDPKYFCKIFKEVTGMSPKEYMKSY